MKKVGEEVFPVAVVPLLGSLERLGFAECHELVSVTHEVREEDFVKAKPVDYGKRTALYGTLDLTGFQMGSRTYNHAAPCVVKD